MTGYHLLVCVLCMLIFALVCVLIFLKIKNLQNALACYAINIVVMCILLYSLFLSIKQYTKEASLSNVSFARNFRHETVIVGGRVSNLTKFALNKCYLDLTIANKVGGGQSAFDPNVKVHKGSNSVHYNVLISDTLPGNTYKDFSVQVPLPPRFANYEFYYILNCI